jgi:hypothetical protein
MRALNTHISNRHKGKPTIELFLGVEARNIMFGCPYCKRYAFKSISGLNKHIAYDHPGMEKAELIPRLHAVMRPVPPAICQAQRAEPILSST